VDLAASRNQELRRKKDRPADPKLRLTHIKISLYVCIMATLAPLSVLFQALADPSRLRILVLLRSMELSVGELAQLLVQSQPRVSRPRAHPCRRRARRAAQGGQLGVPDARSRRSCAADIRGIEQWGGAEAAAQFAADVARLEAVRADRARPQRVFCRPCRDLGQHSLAHVAESEVEQAIEAALGDEPIGRLVDIGTGTGRMIELFGPRRKSAIGVDRSSEMLRLARVKLEASGLRGASLRQGDMYALPLDDASADVVILHQVLHFAHSPAQAISEAARLLGPGGRLLIVDFAPHEREELRESDAHARLGLPMPQ
jgi:ArsR family transcriptional regulator